MTRRSVLVSLLLSVTIASDEERAALSQRMATSDLRPFENALAQVAKQSKTAAGFLAFYRHRHRRGDLRGHSIIPLDDGSPGTFYIFVISERRAFRDDVPFQCQPFPAFGMVRRPDMGPVVRAMKLLRGLSYMGDCFRSAFEDVPSVAWLDRELHANETITQMLDEATGGEWMRSAAGSAMIRDAMLETRGLDADRFVFGPIDGDAEKLRRLFGPLSDPDADVLMGALVVQANLLRAARAAERHVREGQDAEAVHVQYARECLKEFHANAMGLSLP